MWKHCGSGYVERCINDTQTCIFIHSQLQKPHLIRTSFLCFMTLLLQWESTALTCNSGRGHVHQSTVWDKQSIEHLFRLQVRSKVNGSERQETLVRTCIIEAAISAITRLPLKCSFLRPVQLCNASIRTRGGFWHGTSRAICSRAAAVPASLLEQTVGAAEWAE